MSKLLRVAVLAVFAIAVLSVPLLAQQAPPSADTYVSSATPNGNYGSCTLIAVGPGTTGFLEFNLPAVPAGPTMSKAMLRLYVDAVVASGQFDVYSLPSTPAWSKSTLKYNSPPPTPGPSATEGFRFRYWVFLRTRFELYV